jgi:hypothetical protein
MNLDDANQGNEMNETQLDLVGTQDEPKLTRTETFELIADLNTILAEIEADEVPNAEPAV